MSAYSINFYQDRSISARNQKAVMAYGSPEAKKALKDALEQTPRQIFLYLRFSGQTIKVYTERKCAQKEWNSNEQRVNPRFFKDGSIELNSYFDKLSQETAKCYERNNLEGRIISKEDVLAIIDVCNNRKSSQGTTVSFEQAFNEFISIKKPVHAERTLKNYRTTLKHLKAFAETKRIALRFENILLLFEQQFREYMLDVGMTNNSIAKYVRTLKTFMNFCTVERAYNSPLNVQYRKFDSAERDKEPIALSIDELLYLYAYEFDNATYEKVRDVFCFLCFTGLRFSDAEKLVWSDIRQGAIHVVVKKTRQSIVIPLNHYTKALLNKYANNPKPLPVISNQKTNDALHEIGKLIGWNDLVKVVTYRGAEVIETYVSKHQVLTSHVGRKTFITNSLILGIPERTLQAMGAPRHPAVFRKYVAFADTYKQQAMDNAWNPDKLAQARY